MYQPTLASQSGYVFDSKPAPLAERAAAYALESGATPVFAISQDVTMDSDAFLNTIALHLYNRGITSGTKIRTLSLLVLLSSSDSLQDMVNKVLNTAAANDGLVFIEDTYRFGYDPRRSAALLDTLVTVYGQQQRRSPLVLKMPPPSDRKLLQISDALQGHCFHLGRGPLMSTRAAAPQNPQTAAPQNPQPAPPQDPQPAPSRPSAAQPEEPVERPQPAAVEPDPRERIPGNFWYLEYPALLPSEYDGLMHYMNNRGIRGKVYRPNRFKRTGRAFIEVQITLPRVGNCTFTIVYDNDFCKGDLESVSVGIRTYRTVRVRGLLNGINCVYDDELGGRLFSPRRDPMVLTGYGAAAATLDGIVRCMLEFC